MRAALILAVCLIAAAFRPAFGQAANAPSRYEKIQEANTLDREGKTPFHIKISFQLYDLNGKPSDTGDVEEWWIAPGQSKIVVQAGSLKTAGTVDFEDTLKMDPRERYFIRRLLYAEVHPVPLLGPADQAKLVIAPKTFSAATLDCLSVPPNNVDGSGRNPLDFCVDPATNALRIDFELRVSSTVRNGVGTFHGTTVSLNTEIAFEKRLAITGKVTTLQPFDAAKSDIKFPAPAPASINASNSTVTAGKIKSKIPPRYPDYARATQQSGTVVLSAMITKQGTIKNVVPLASPNITFTQAAVDAVKQWTYEPYLLNGQPTEVDTVINVNFLFGGR